MEYKPHEIALCWPEMDAESYRELVGDIKDNGLRDAITLYEDKILDGRTRYAACLDAGVAPFFEEYHGDDPIGFAISRNNNRKHLTASQRAMAADKLARLPSGNRRFQPPEPNAHARTQHENLTHTTTQPIAAKSMNVSRRAVQQARAIRESGDEKLVREVEIGKKSLRAATKQITQAKQAKRVDKPAVADDAPFREVISLITRAKAIVKAIGEHPEYSAYLPTQRITTDLDNARNAIKFAAPYAVCPYCGGNGCRTCGDRHWVSRAIWNQAPKELKRKYEP